VRFPKEDFRVRNGFPRNMRHGGGQCGCCRLERRLWMQQAQMQRRIQGMSFNA
jgi:hypothetical protein